MIHGVGRDTEHIAKQIVARDPNGRPTAQVVTRARRHKARKSG